ncbi:Rv3654c family TadE-like protein [Actinomadura sp. HBU206391]|uniref:Rv3654c family TadE-like protein n=1 Tax=Actinomadura sp. HBU206391 TaxID=2731692 RepID=UPI0016505F40|nr:Rv3654c family TadE-like protein [Actinomadura sp. HBU206391]MBC6459549.1 hypothetical protein [Actinomadura sp. HBU206391]
MTYAVHGTGRDRATAGAGPADGWSRAAGRRVRRVRADRGSGTLWAIALMTVIWAAAVLAMTVGGVRAARHRAHAAADLAALAAASHAAAGSGADRACGRASEIAAGSGGRLSACVLRGPVADVAVTVTIRIPVSSRPLRLVVRSRAGPAGPGGVTSSPDSRCTECQ